MANMPNPIQMQKYLSGVDYPAHRGDLLEQARQHGADSQVLDALGRIPDQRYDGPSAVSKAVADLRQ